MLPAYSKYSSLGALLLSVHQPRDKSITPSEKLIAIRPQDKWICASESNADQIPRHNSTYGASYESIPSDEEIGFRVIEVPDGLTEYMSVCKLGFLGQVWRYVLVVCFFVEHNPQVSNKVVN